MHLKSKNHTSSRYARSRWRQFVCCLPVLLLSTTGYAQTAKQLFECKDKNGQKLFAHTCPADGQTVREIELPPPNTTAKTKAVPKPKAYQGQHWREANADFKARQAQRDAIDAQARDQQRAEEEQCYRDHKRLAELNNGMPLFEGKDDKGEPLLMDDAKRQAEIDEKLKRTKHCKAQK